MGVYFYFATWVSSLGVTEPWVLSLLHSVMTQRPGGTNQLIFIDLASGGLVPWDKVWDRISFFYSGKSGA